MERVQIAIEVGPIETATVERLKADGYEVYRGNRSWRVVTVEPVHPREAVRDQAERVAREVIKAYGLQALSDPPATSLRDPDTMLDARGTQLFLDDTKRSYDPDPRPKVKRKWYQVAMELGLGERKQ